MNLAAVKKKIKLRLLTKLLNGHNVTCNICNQSFSTFIAYLNRINSQCPNCGSLERTRLIYQFIKDKGLITSNTKLLHIAPEECLYNIFRSTLSDHYTPADKFDEGYTYPKGTQYIDITKMQFADASFDMVICIHVLEHIQDDEKAVAEIYRVLKKGGTAILQVPFENDRLATYEDQTIISPEERRKHFQHPDHVRIYGIDYLDRFVKPGFTIEHKDYRARMDSTLASRLAIRDEEIFLLRK